MKAIITLITILILGLGVSGQGSEFILPPPSSSVKLTKQQQKELKERQKREAEAAKKAKKDAEKAAKAEIAKRTVNFTELTKFPADFVGRPLRVERAVLRDIEPYTEDGITIYLIALEKGNERTWATFSYDEVTFFSNESVARGLVRHIAEMRSGGIWPRDFNPLVDMYFEMVKGDLRGRRFYLARADCVAVYGFLSRLTRFGNC